MKRRLARPQTIRGVLYSPRQVADLLGVSESTIKRWVDDGSLKAGKTRGGHRRIERAEVIRYARTHQLTLRHPDLRPNGPELAFDAGRLVQLLIEGRGTAARSLIVGAYLQGVSLASVLDGPVRETLERFGERWEQGDPTQGILDEHYAVQQITEALAEIRGYISPPPEAPSAVGGAVEGDPYRIPSQMVDLVLAERGHATHNLGANTPVDVVAEAARRYGARIIWVSVSHQAEGGFVADDLERLAEAADRLGARVILGGRGLPEVPQAPHVEVLDSMSQLASSPSLNPSLA